VKYSTHVRCACMGEDGKALGQACPRLWRKDGSWNSRHGSSGFAVRIPTSEGTKLVRRFGYTSGAATDAAARQVIELLELAGADTPTKAAIGDMIAAAKRGAPLPTVADVRRRLALGQDPGSSGMTFGEAWPAWLAGKKRLRRSSRERLEQIGQHWLLPVLDGVALEKLNGAHCAEVFTRIERINAAITAQQGGGRAYVHVEGDVRSRPRLVSIATMHRVYAALREFCNHEMKRTRRLAHNPVFAVELPPEVTPEAQRWSAEQARTFLHASEGDPLHLLFRIVLLFGPRRGEAAGLRWSGADLDAGHKGGPDGPAHRLRGDRGHPEDPGGRAADLARLEDHRAAAQAPRRAGPGAPVRGRGVAGQWPDLLPQRWHPIPAGLRDPPLPGGRPGRGPAADQAARGPPQRGLHAAGGAG
jgi:hypothetical protein